MSSGLERGYSSPSLSSARGSNFSACCSFLVQALIFGVLAGALVRYVVLLLPGLGVFVGSSLVRLVLITVGFGTVGGKGVVTASPPGLVNQLRKVFLIQQKRNFFPEKQ